MQFGLVGFSYYDHFNLPLCLLTQTSASAPQLFLWFAYVSYQVQIYNYLTNEVTHNQLNSFLFSLVKFQIYLSLPGQKCCLLCNHVYNIFYIERRGVQRELLYTHNLKRLNLLNEFSVIIYSLVSLEPRLVPRTAAPAVAGY